MSREQLSCIAQAAHSGPFQALQGKETPPTLQEETISLCIFVLPVFQDAVVGIASKVWVHTLCRVWESSGRATDKAFVVPVCFFSEVADLMPCPAARRPHQTNF